MRYLMLASAFSVVGLMAGQALASSCDFQTFAMTGDRPLVIHECWDLSKWPAAKAQAFCKNAQASEDDATTQTRVVAACPAPRVAQCTGAKLSAPSTASMPPEYFAQMPKEIADQIRASLNEAGAALKPYEGLETTVHYYAVPASGVTLEDQRTDCVSGKKGQFSPVPGR